MKALVAVLLVSLVATAAGAGLDPDPDSFGVYFDPLGNTNRISENVFTPFNVYLLLMNPRGTTDGFECTVAPRGDPYFIMSTTLPPGALDVDPSANGFAVGAASPFASAEGAMLLCTWVFMLLSADHFLEFYITQASQPSLPGSLPVVTGNGVLRRCGVASGDVWLPVAVVNDCCALGTEVSTFGAVKSLFR